MLKAYDYIEYLPDSGALQNSRYFEKELEIARETIEKTDSKENFGVSECPACGEKEYAFFCRKWGVPYFRCKACETVFACVEPEALEQYNQAEELTEFRTSREYQEEVAKRREITWTEALDWISFRTFRYLGRNQGLDILDVGNRYEAYAKKIAEADLSKNYQLTDSILQGETLSVGEVDKADIVLYFDQMQKALHPLKALQQITGRMKAGTLFFFSTRMGTGFDVLTLKEHSKIFPYEHIFLPSKRGMEILLKKAGLRILEYSTPGKMDVRTVIQEADKIDEGNYFVKSLIQNCDEASLAEFQRFLQKSHMSSYMQIVAVKE